jgi:hypothetical protein
MWKNLNVDWLFFCQFNPLLLIIRDWLAALYKIPSRRLMGNVGCRTNAIGSFLSKKKGGKPQKQRKNTKVPQGPIQVILLSTKKSASGMMTIVFFFCVFFFFF